MISTCEQIRFAETVDRCDKDEFDEDEDDDHGHGLVFGTGLLPMFYV